jgi:hypothetical protein
MDNEVVKFEIYTDNPPINSRPLKNQVTELRQKIQSMILTDEEKEALEQAISRELDAEWYGGDEPPRVTILRKLKERLS